MSMTIDLGTLRTVPDPGSGHDWALSVHSIIRCVECVVVATYQVRFYIVVRIVMVER